MGPTVQVGTSRCLLWACDRLASATRRAETGRCWFAVRGPSRDFGKDHGTSQGRLLMCGGATGRGSGLASELGGAGGASGIHQGRAKGVSGSMQTRIRWLRPRVGRRAQQTKDDSRQHFCPWRELGAPPALALKLVGLVPSRLVSNGRLLD